MSCRKARNSAPSLIYDLREHSFSQSAIWYTLRDSATLIYWDLLTTPRRTTRAWLTPPALTFTYTRKQWPKYFSHLTRNWRLLQFSCTWRQYHVDYGSPAELMLSLLAFTQLYTHSVYNCLRKAQVELNRELFWAWEQGILRGAGCEQGHNRLSCWDQTARNLWREIWLWPLNYLDMTMHMYSIISFREYIFMVTSIHACQKTTVMTDLYHLFAFKCECVIEGFLFFVFGKCAKTSQLSVKFWFCAF